jgi:hypothetical protein
VTGSGTAPALRLFLVLLVVVSTKSSLSYFLCVRRAPVMHGFFQYRFTPRHAKRINRQVLCRENVGNRQKLSSASQSASSASGKKWNTSPVRLSNLPQQSGQVVLTKGEPPAHPPARLWLSDAPVILCPTAEAY